MGKVCIVGRRTYDRLPMLKGRGLVVLTRRPILDDCTASRSLIGVAHSVDDVLARLAPDADAMVIGGAEVYRAMLPKCDRLLLTVVERDYPDADVRLDRPDALTDGLVCLSREYHQPDDANPVGVTFSEWVRP